MPSRVCVELASLVSLSAAACGSGNLPAAADAGPDASASDSSPTSCAEAGPIDDSGGALPPVGTQLQAGTALSVRGVTSDGYLIYSDDDALVLRAVALAGGPVQDLGSLGSKFWVTVVGGTVFSWSNVSDANVGALAVWTAKTGLNTVSSTSLGIDATASPAGDPILFIDHVDTDAKSGDVYVANADGTNATRLLSAVSLDGCYPHLGFAGSTVIASFCPAPPPQSGAPSATISSFAPPAFARVDHATHAANYLAIASAPDRALVSTAAGVMLVPIGGGTPLTIDEDGFFGTFSNDGQSIFYSTRSHAFKRSPASTPAPVTLVPNDFGGAYSLSPDEQWVLYFWNFGATGTDVYLASAAAPAPAVMLWPAQTGAVLGDPFTSDSSYALYASDVDPCLKTGTLHAFATAVATDIVLGQRVFVERALDGERVLFSDDYATTGGLRFGRADIELVDLAQGQAPTRMVSRADAIFGLSPAQDQLVYSWSVRAALAGIYVVPLK